MPGRRKNQKRVNRRRMRRYRRKPRTTLVNRSLQPFPSRYITKLKYSGAFVLNVGNNYSQTMNLNSVYDPDRTNLGHQPYGYDQITPLYNRYRVISCSYVINAYSGSTPIRYACLPCNETPPINNLSELCENPRARFKLQYPGGNTTSIIGKSYLPALVGRNKTQYMADDRYQATVVNNPAELALLYITAQSMADAATDVNLTVTLEYTVEFFDAHPLDQS